MTLAPAHSSAHTLHVPAPRGEAHLRLATAPAGQAATPYLALDLAMAVRRFRMLARTLPGTAVHYAVKANPHPALLAALAGAGCRFDVASPAEVRACLRAG